MNNTPKKLHKIVEVRLAQAKRLHAGGRLGEAEALFSQLMKEVGGDALAVLAMAGAAAEMGEAEAALALYRRADALSPGSALIQGHLGTFLARIGKAAEAVPLLKAATAHAPANAQLFYNLGKVLAESGAPQQAIEAYRQAIRLDPKFTWALVNLGNSLADIGLHDEAAQAYRQALDLEPANAGFWNNYLLSSQYAEGVTAASLFSLSQGFETHVGASLSKRLTPHGNSRDPERPLRIGYVSPDLKRHPVGYFLSGVLPNHDADWFDIRVYSNHLKEDDLSLRLKAHVPNWTMVCGMDDKTLAQRIREDGIDILIDLAGHTANNRLTVFGRKPAPVQVAWCGYVGTTGLRAMDALIADRHHIPPAEESFYVERVIRLPDSWLCYTPPAAAPPVAPAPAFTKGHVTFGCFNNPAKISKASIRLWQRILDKVPGARLCIRAAFFRTEEQIAIYRQRFSEAGADVARIDFMPALPQDKLLEAYGEIDIALDPFPYSGGITTLEALWMGVPVITKSGASFPGRHSTSFLSTIGRQELIADSEEAYLEKALALAKDKERLAAYRAHLRSQLSTSPLLDHKGFVAHLEKALRGLWREYCSTTSR
ncbi:MAG: tetratricopeptide repeat protein [Alphaproteobacteria bacterium]|nr:tetratricopeptide repeat protein [Alphaproteobacteria bacterium]